MFHVPSIKNYALYMRFTFVFFYFLFFYCVVA